MCTESTKSTPATTQDLQIHIVHQIRAINWLIAVIRMNIVQMENANMTSLSADKRTLTDNVQEAMHTGTTLAGTDKTSSNTVPTAAQTGTATTKTTIMDTCPLPRR